MAKRCHINVRSSSTRRIDTLSSNQVIDENYGTNPENGDVVIGEVCELGQHTKFEEPGGREIKLQRGNVVAAVLGRRYSTKEFCGKIPDNLTLKTKFDLLNVGGIAGIVLSHNTLSKVPTKLFYLGHAVNGMLGSPALGVNGSQLILGSSSAGTFTTVISGGEL